MATWAHVGRNDWGLAVRAGPTGRSVHVETQAVDREDQGAATVRIVITGASGNLGTALLRRLARDGSEHEVVGVVRRPPTAAGAPYDAVSWVELDLAEPGAREALQPVMSGADAVVHLVWGFQPSRDVAYLDRTGVGGTSAVLAAAGDAGVAHLVHLSSIGAYSPGPDDRRVDESWPTEGIESLAYSREKVAAERLLDEYESANPDGTAIARIRPAVVLQRDAGSALLRYGLPPYVPAALLRHLPVLPVDRRLVVQVVHADDVADAVIRVLEQRATGAFNVAAEPPLTRDDIAEALGARPVHVPMQVLRMATALAWRARLQPLDPGWLDLGLAVPLMDTTRAQRELGWRASVTAYDALTEAVDGMTDAAATSSPALRPRSVLRQLGQLVRRGPIGDRRLP